MQMEVWFHLKKEVQEYEPVSRKFGKKESLQKNTAEKEMIQNVIKQAPSKVPTIPKKGI